MATRSDSEGFVATLLKDKGARPKDSSFRLSDESASALGRQRKSIERLNQTF